MRFKQELQTLNDKKISNVQKDTEIKALQAKSLAEATPRTASWGEKY
jgi:hypothetical protein